MYGTIHFYYVARIRVQIAVIFRFTKKSDSCQPRETLDRAKIEMRLHINTIRRIGVQSGTNYT